jgi:hypothetical protein
MGRPKKSVDTLNIPYTEDIEQINDNVAETTVKVLENSKVDPPTLIAYSFIRVSDGQTGGFTQVRFVIRGDKVLKTEIGDKFSPLAIAEDKFRVGVALELLHPVTQKTYDIQWDADTKEYIWKS